MTSISKDSSNDVKCKPKTCKKKKIRCAICRKKINLTHILCKCNNYYCMKHRYADKHNCEFDYHKEHRDKIKLENPIIKRIKMEKI